MGLYLLLNNKYGNDPKTRNIVWDYLSTSSFLDDLYKKRE